jgi:hypothetical protein
VFAAPPNKQLGGKGANLCEMAKCGVNIPPGLTITTEVCEEFYRVGECVPVTHEMVCIVAPWVNGWLVLAAAKRRVWVAHGVGVCFCSTRQRGR